MIDYEGHLCKVFFTAGCNFRCGFCYNSEMIHADTANLSWDQVSEVLAQAQEEWVDAVCISGGEPTIHAHLKQCISWFKEKGFLVKLDTNGSLPERLSEVIDTVDYIAMDYKSSLDSYQEVSGVMVDTKNITESVTLLKERAQGKYEIRTTVIHPIHSEGCMRKIGEELAGIEKYILQPFVPQETLYDPLFSSIERTDAAYLEKVLEIVKTSIPNTSIRGVGM
jgi:pyruvate formate lyase activating enzyme